MRGEPAGVLLPSSTGTTRTGLPTAPRVITLTVGGNDLLTYFGIAGRMRAAPPGTCGAG